ncbi:MAG: metalloregulator ArsR/SmtB family transcription factor [bacterium]
MSNFRKEIDVGRFAETFKALSNPHRLEIFLTLAACCAPGSSFDNPAVLQKCVGELGEGLGIAPSTVSHHIKELRQAGLIRVERRGQNLNCWVESETLRALEHFFAPAA